MCNNIAPLLERLSSIMVDQGDDPVEVAGPATEESIKNIERDLGVNLPEDYRRFLKDFGAFSIADAHFFGVWDEEGKSTSGATVLGETLRLREGSSLPHDFIPFYCPVYDLYVCMNCSPVKSEHEVVYFDSSQGIYECKHAKTFVEFVEHYLNSYIKEIS